MLGHQVHLTALNAKTDPAPELIAEFDRKFSHESPEALAWAFEAWRDKSSFFPAVSDIRKLILEWRRRERERLELESKMQESFLIEEARRRGELLTFPQAVKQLIDFAKTIPQPEHLRRAQNFQHKMASVAQIVPALQLSEEQIAARREREREECERYRLHADSEFR